MPNNVVMAIQLWPSAIILGASTSLANLMETLQKSYANYRGENGDNQLGINTNKKLDDHQLTSTILVY